MDESLTMQWGAEPSGLSGLGMIVDGLWSVRIINPDGQSGRKILITNNEVLAMHVAKLHNKWLTEEMD